MNSVKIHPGEVNLSETRLFKRILGATAAAILIAWWGIHLNSLIQAVVAASDTQLTTPNGTHRLVGMDTSANLAVIFVYAIGLVILFCTMAVGWPIFALVPRQSRFWRLPVFILLGCSLPICVIIVESLIGSTRSPDKWTNAGFNHLVMDAAGYLFLGVSYGVVAWIMARIYIIREWALSAWMGFGFATLAVPCSLAALSFRQPSESGYVGAFDVLFIGVVPWPIIDTFLCFIGALLGGIGWFFFHLIRRSPAH
jgi:hypothetical protein